jgi:hypothetical protein
MWIYYYTEGYSTASLASQSLDVPLAKLYDALTRRYSEAVIGIVPGFNTMGASELAEERVKRTGPRTWYTAAVSGTVRVATQLVLLSSRRSLTRPENRNLTLYLMDSPLESVFIIEAPGRFCRWDMRFTRDPDPSLIEPVCEVHTDRTQYCCLKYGPMQTVVSTMIYNGDYPKNVKWVEQ